MTLSSDEVPAWALAVAQAEVFKPRTFADPATVVQHGRFVACAGPWINLGANVMPIAPGEKNPALAGWGDRPSKSTGRWLARDWGLCDGAALHREGSPKIPMERYGEWARDFREHGAFVFPATLGCTVVDIDDPTLLARALRACGDTPYRTYSGRVGGGVHLWYKGVSKSRNKIVPGIDVKSSGGGVLVPGDIHPRTGHEYTCSDELRNALLYGAKFDPPTLHPDWLVRIRHVASTITRPTRMDLGELADQLANAPKSREVGRRLRLVAAGKPFAEDGERDGVLFRLLAELSKWWPGAETESIMALLGPSLSSLGSDDDWHFKARDKWERLTDAHEDELEAADIRLDRLRRMAWAWVGEQSCEQAELGEPIVAHRGRSYYVRIGEHWIGPWVREDFTPDTIAAIRATYDIGINDMNDLLAGYGQRVRDVVHSFMAQRTALNEGVLEVATAPVRRELEAVYSPRVDAGLRALAGPWAAHLMQWIAGITRQDVPSRALVLSGRRGTGKTLLLEGLARLWENGAVQMRSVLGKRFNDAMLSSPYAIADDDSSPAESGEALAAFLRQAVSDREQTVEKKFADTMKIRGCMRFAIATNDPLDLVQGAVSYKLNDESVAAFAERLMHVPVQPSCIGWWGDFANDLVAGDEIAKHALWLAEQMPAPVLGERFWVGSADTSLETLATLSSGLRGDVLLYLALMGDTYRVGTNFEVTAQKLMDDWHMDRPRGMSLRTAGAALKALAAASKVPQPHGEGPRRHRISAGLVSWYAAHQGV